MLLATPRARRSCRPRSLPGSARLYRERQPRRQGFFRRTESAVERVSERRRLERRRRIAQVKGNVGLAAGQHEDGLPVQRLGEVACAVPAWRLACVRGRIRAPTSSRPEAGRAPWRRNASLALQATEEAATRYLIAKCVSIFGLFNKAASAASRGYSLPLHPRSLASGVAAWSCLARSCGCCSGLLAATSARPRTFS